MPQCRQKQPVVPEPTGKSPVRKGDAQTGPPQGEQGKNARSGTRGKSSLTLAKNRRLSRRPGRVRLGILVFRSSFLLAPRCAFGLRVFGRRVA